MRTMEKKAEAAANIYVQGAMAKTEPQDACWAAKEDYIAGYLTGAYNEQLVLEQRRAKALRYLAELIRVADGRGELYSATQARFIMELLK